MAAFPVLYSKKNCAYNELYDYAESFEKAITDLFTFGMNRNLIDEDVKVLFCLPHLP